MADSNLAEEWRPVVGYEGLYEVSDLGRVRRLERLVAGSTAGTRRLKPRLRKTAVVRGYAVVQLTDESGAHEMCRVHRLVLKAFVGPCPDGMQGCHDNGDALDNRLRNLRWDTRSGNEADKLRHGTHIRGERHPNLVLTDGVVRKARELKQGGAGLKEISARLGISEVSAWRAIRFGKPQPRNGNTKSPAA